MIKVAKAFLLLVLASSIELSMSVVRGRFGFTSSILIGFILFFVVAFIAFKLSRALTAHVIVVFMFIGVSVLLLPPRIVDFQGTMVSLPDYVFHSLGLFAAYCFYIVRSPAKWISVGLSITLTLFMFFKGYSMWLHKLNYDNYTGRYFARLPEFTAEDGQGKIVSNVSIAGKLVLMDVWHTRCGACFRKFPALNELYLKYKDNDKVRFIAMNYPLETDRPAQAYDMIAKRGYSFPVAKLKTVGLLDSLGVTVFPTTYLVDGKGIVVFKGSLDNAIKEFERSIKNETR